MLTHSMNLPNVSWESNAGGNAFRPSPLWLSGKRRQGFYGVLSVMCARRSARTELNVVGLKVQRCLGACS